MVKRSPTLGTLVSTKTKCIKLIFIGKITLLPVAFLMALSIVLKRVLVIPGRDRDVLNTSRVRHSKSVTNFKTSNTFAFSF